MARTASAVEVDATKSLMVTYDGYHSGYLHQIISLIEKDLSEPYSIFTYHYFVQEHPHLCRTAWNEGKLVGVIIGKIGDHRGALRGYIGMLAVDTEYRRLGIGNGLCSFS